MNTFLSLEDILQLLSRQKHIFKPCLHFIVIEELYFHFLQRRCSSHITQTQDNLPFMKVSQAQPSGLCVLADLESERPQRKYHFCLGLMVYLLSRSQTFSEQQFHISKMLILVHWKVLGRIKNYSVCVCVCQWLSRVQLFETAWTVTHQTPLSMQFSRQESWSGQPQCP